MNLYGGFLREHKLALIISAIIAAYFVAMDITLYCHIQDREPVKVAEEQFSMDAQNIPHLESSSDASNTKQLSNNYVIKRKSIMVSPFAHLDIKFIMLDHLNLYIITPLAAAFAKITRFSDLLFFITPNMISFMGVLMGFLSLRLFSSQTRRVVLMGIIAQLVRNFFDALDGIIAKSNNTNSYVGYLVDGTADTISIIAMMYGVYLHILGSQKISNGYSAVYSYSDHQPDVEHNGESNKRLSNSSKRIFSAVLCYGIVIAISGTFWNIFHSAYYGLLEDDPKNQNQADLQNAIIRSLVMWLITLAWRLLNSFALVEMLLLAIFLGKAWEFLVWMKYTGFIIMLILVSFTTIHYYDTKNLIYLAENDFR